MALHNPVQDESLQRDKRFTTGFIYTSSCQISTTSYVPHESAIEAHANILDTSLALNLL